VPLVSLFLLAILRAPENFVSAGNVDIGRARTLRGLVPVAIVFSLSDGHGRLSSEPDPVLAKDRYRKGERFRQLSNHLKKPSFAFPLFTDARALVAYVGFYPVINESGDRVATPTCRPWALALPAIPLPRRRQCRAP
jgi:hypothetical protein